MTELPFWDIIALLDWNKAGDDDAVLEPAIAALQALSIDDIKQFDDILAMKLHALDTESHAREIGEEAYLGPGKYFSPDWFLYTRCCVLGNGKLFYEQVLSDPKKMPKDMEFESLLYLATYAFERKTGEDYDYCPTIDYETFSNKLGWGIFESAGE